VKNRIAWLVGSIAALLLAGPPAAQAADVAASRPCYVYDGAQRPLVIGATGFAPNHTVDFRAGTRPLAQGFTDNRGRVLHTFTVGELYRGHLSQRVTVSVSDGATFASTSFGIERFDAVIAPSSGSPARRVRVSLFGWGSSTLYLHYVPPHAHRAVRTVRLGRTHGVSDGCGHLVVRLPHLYPFRPRAGTWTLQFDTRRGYSSRSVPRIGYRSRVFVR